MTARTRLRRLAFGLATVLGLARRGYFIPYRYAGDAPESRRPYRWIEALFERAVDGRFAETLALMDGCREAYQAIARGAADPAPGGATARWDQDWFTGLDAAAAYAIVRHARPARILEVGSGHSTRFMARAVADAGLATEIVCVDPAPRATIAALGVTFIRSTVEAAFDRLPQLGPGDILFVDSSHLAVPGRDVDLLLCHLVPALPAGALVHIHDMFLPDPYPEAWAWRGYGEQLVAAGLLGNPRFAPLFASRWLRTRRPAAGRMLDGLPIPADALESSLWLQVTAG